MAKKPKSTVSRLPSEKKQGEAPEVGHNGVAYEKTDIKTGKVAEAGLVLFGISAMTSLIMIWFYWFLMSAEAPGKVTTLPPAALDRTADRLPPQPRLEALEDLRDPKNRRFQLFPDRAEEYYAEQIKLLENGGEGKLKINTAIAEAAKLLPARKDSPAPDSFQRQLPSKAASGTRPTGGQ